MWEEERQGGSLFLPLCTARDQSILPHGHELGTSSRPWHFVYISFA